MNDLPSDEWIRAGGEIDRVSVSLRVAGDDLEPESVSRALGVAPTFMARKGERRMSGEREVVQPTGVWSFALPDSPEWEIADALRELFSRLPSPGPVWDILADGGAPCPVGADRSQVKCGVLPTRGCLFHALLASSLGEKQALFFNHRLRRDPRTAVT